MLHNDAQEWNAMSAGGNAHGRYMKSRRREGKLKTRDDGATVRNHEAGATYRAAPTAWPSK